MKMFILLFLLIPRLTTFAAVLPVFTTQPNNSTVFLGGTATFTASAMGAISYQWRFDGVDIPDATNAILQVLNVQMANSGYYTVIAKNSTGWVPGQIAYLFINYKSVGAGTLPFSNTNNTYFLGQLLGPTNGRVEILAGPQLDEMALVGSAILYNPPHIGFAWFYNGYYAAADQTMPTSASGQPVYYSILYTNINTTPQLSTVILLNAGTNGSPAPPAFGLKFPEWPEWPEPHLNKYPTTQQIRVSGETITFESFYSAYTDFGIPYVQWRKDGRNISGATNYTYLAEEAQSTFTITNIQSSDAGVYDVEIFGNNWEDGPKIYVSVQTTNGQGVLQNPQFNGTNFSCSLLGAPTRNYDVQWSTNLVAWNDLLTVSNTTGTVAFTNASPSLGVQFYRTILLP